MFAILMVAAALITAGAIAIAQYTHPERYATTPGALARAEDVIAARAARKASR